MYKRVDRDRALTHVMCTDVLKIPRYKGFGQPPTLGQIGDEPGMEGNVILDRLTGNLCWHDGGTWQCISGGNQLGSLGQQVTVFYADPAETPFFAVTLTETDLNNPPLYGATTMTAPNGIGVVLKASASSSFGPLDWTGGNGDLAITNTSNEIVRANIMAYFNYRYTGVPGEPLAILSHAFNYSINNVLLATPPLLLDSVSYKEGVVRSYMNPVSTNDNQTEYSGSVTMHRLIQFAPGDTVRIVGSLTGNISSPPNSVRIIITDFKINGTVIDIL